MDWFKLGYSVLGGLGIFFFGMKLLSESLQAISGTMIKKIINSLTKNRLVAVGVGLLITTIVQSSSVTTVMVVGFVNAGLMSLVQAIGVILGANIGTTITGWLLAIKVSKYSLLLVGVGAFPMLFAKNERLLEWGKVFFGVGLVFIGLNTMSGAFKPLRSNEDFLVMMQYFSADSYFSVLAAAGVGCLLTFVIQSSSAMLGITIALATTGAISFPTAVALVLGENIGTTITALLAGVGANVAAKRAAAAHAVFNLLGVIVITSIFPHYIKFIEHLISGAASASEGGEYPFIAAHIAAAHSVFNVTNVVLFIPFINQLANLVSRLVPEKGYKEPQHLEFLGTPSTLSPTIAIEQGFQEIKKMAAMVQSMLAITKEYLASETENKELQKKVHKYEGITDNIQMEVMIFFGKVMEATLTKDQTEEVKSLLRISDELESVADCCESIVNHRKRLFKQGNGFGDKTDKELDRLMGQVVEIYEHGFKSLTEEAMTEIDGYNNFVEEFNKEARKVKENDVYAIAKGEFAPLAGLALNDLVVQMRRIKSHTTNIIDAQLGGKQFREEIF